MMNLPKPQNMLDKMKETMGMKEPKEQTLLGDLEDSITLTKMQRLYGFAFCFGLGVFLSFMSTFFLFPIPRVKKFAVIYTFGNLLSMGCTCFLVGPWSQIKNMFKSHRLLATCTYLGFIFLTLLAALKLENLLLTLVCLICQCCALVWYCLTYLPFGQRMLKSCLGKCIGDFDEW
mmetsp:Transcript_1712/g.3839  ORF Transcript_1712/g.3839 Transcript_1712/m.3839 type:complete len:175 (+) Transcript_1712:25-549(+)